MASVRVELKTDMDISEAMDEIESAVGLIQTFPGAAERPEFREMDSRTSMIRLIVHGDIPERSLKELAHQVGDDLSTLPNVSHVETTGTRNYEISIEVPPARLRAYRLTLDDVADAARRSSLDLSAGSIDTRQAEVRVRTIGQRYDQPDFEEIVVFARNDGTVIRLGDLADVRDAFQDRTHVSDFGGATVRRSRGIDVLPVRPRWRPGSRRSVPLRPASGLGAEPE